MLYLIGGKSQVGKSEISKRIKKLKPNLTIIEMDKYRLQEPDPDWGAWDRIVKYISLHRENDFIIEGVGVIPERVKELEEDYTLRAVFIGFADEKYVNEWIRYAKEHPNEYLEQEEIRRKILGEQSQFLGFSGEVKGSNDIKERAEKLGYKYFGMTDAQSFEERIQPIINYLLNKWNYKQN